MSGPRHAKPPAQGDAPGAIVVSMLGATRSVWMFIYRGALSRQYLGC